MSILERLSAIRGAHLAQASLTRDQWRRYYILTLGYYPFEGLLPLDSGPEYPFTEEQKRDFQERFEKALQAAEAAKTTKV